VTFNARSIVKHSQYSGICNVNIRSINVLDSPVDNPVAVSALLLAIFPNLTEVGACFDFNFVPRDTMKELEQRRFKWQEVNKLIRLQEK
jgi:hypothetical protein